MVMAAHTELMDRVTCDLRILGGKPVIRGTRISVVFILECLAGMTKEEILADYPVLTEEDVQAALLYAAGGTRCGG